MFQSNGYLRPGMHEHTVSSMRENFVKLPILSSTQRTLIFTEYEKLLSVLNLLKIFPEQWIGGSFVTTKLVPSDIDLISICDASQLDQIPTELQNELEP